MNKRILVVDDEKHILELIEYNLIENGYEVETSVEGLDAIEKIKGNKYDLIILDLMLPGINGIEICKKARNELKISTPIIMLTAKSEEIDKILGLEFGADDYITKPFSIRELMARVKAILRRNATTGEIVENENVIIINDLVIDKEKYEVTIKNDKVALTLKEFELLTTLAGNRGKVLTRDNLLDAIWGYDYIGETRTVDVHVRYLRKKLNDSDGKYIETVRGIGYKMK